MNNTIKTGVAGISAGIGIGILTAQFFAADTYWAAAGFFSVAVVVYLTKK